MNVYKPNKDKWKEELHLALEREEFCLLYQPKLNLKTGKLCGVEALIRWEHPEQGIISPLDFIPAAEETGMILPIGEWVLRTACMQNKAWQEQGLSSMIVAVNLSAPQLYQGDLAEKVQSVLDESGLAPEYLELEITESMTMDVHAVLPVLHQLKRMGVRISMDDFGTGFSSLYHLKEFPIDSIKIDRSFVRNCTNDSKDATIVKTIIAMAHQLKLEVIAEGVEFKDHLVFLQQNLCDEAQGYLFSKPVSPEEFVNIIPKLEGIIPNEGISPETSRESWLKWGVEKTQQDLQEAVRKQQGMIFKFTKKNGRFIHGFSDGELIYRMQFTPQQLIGKELKEFLSQEEADRKMPYYERAWNGEENVVYESNVQGLRYVTSLRPVIRGGKVVEVIGCSVDITDRKVAASLLDNSDRRNSEEALRQSEARYRLIAENMTDLLCIIDWDGYFKYASPSHVTVLGFPAVAYEGKYAGDFMHTDDRRKVREQLDEMVATQKGTVLKFRFKNIRGDWIWLEGKANPIFDENGVFNHFLVVSRDITERLELEEKLTYMAYHDTLTGLPNRRLFKEKLDQALEEAKQTKKKVAVMYLDLDNFKYINDTLGHDVGDELLNQFAQRVKECLREEDVLSRQGGDEFTILLPGIEEEQDAIRIADNIRASFQRAWNIGRNLFKTTSSIGIAFYPAHGKKGYELMRSADTALYQAKKGGKNIYRSYLG
ncbi:PAS domain S-box-containing protein/diguanylate cyclase (GGDEF) domain-containing protein [Terribacillus saccharophilus]|uniref:PAS domain S-box-containing protein/diguanylate cyclase (GGDEF) domain-containing protein n=1 Tax=Terribacillus saccharophilus TaxID=361277 RepID=A0AAX2EI75_9BACI|nr:PAS domain S-box-containing protein/diguanylate cyclase (GGDEF) domain-containing protein [Terribacillus saccharophilus]